MREGETNRMKKITLSNGVRVLLEPMENVRSVSIGLWFGTGSNDETMENNGVSHFIEHMMFKGTEKRTAKEIAEEFDRIGGQVNAFTSKEYTCYYARVLDQHASYAIEILADMLFHSTYAEEELAKERRVILEEISMYEDTPDELVHDMILTAAYPQHPLGYSILGTEEVLNTFSSQKLHDHVEGYYTPENLVIAIAGHIPADLLSQIEALFGQYQGRRLVEDQEAPTFYSGRIVKKKETEQAHLCLAVPAFIAGDERNFPLLLLNQYLGGSASSLLFQEIREARGLAYSVYSYHTAYQQTGIFTFYAGTAPDQLLEVTKLMLAQAKSLIDTGMTEEQLYWGKENLKGSLMLSLESVNSRMIHLGKNELVLGRHRTLDQIIELIEGVTVDDIKEVATQLFMQPMAAALIGPYDSFPDEIEQVLKNSIPLK